MAYFQHQRDPGEDYTRQFAPAREDEQDEYDDYNENDEYDGYDDGFDDLTEDPPEEETLSEEEALLLEEERREARRRRFRIAAGFGDFAAALAGAVVILALLAFLIQMVKFLSTDITQNFSLWQTKF